MESESRVIQLGISGTDSSKRHTLECVRTVDRLDLPPQSLQFNQLVQQFPYLRGLPVKSYNGATPRILIGLEDTELLVTLKKRAGRPSEPVATKTKLGWTVYGTVEGLNEPFEHRLLHICSGSNDRELHDVVKVFFSIENTGVVAAPAVEAEDVRRAREIMQRTTVRTASGRFETGLLWCYDYIEFPNSRPMAERRLKCLVRRLEKTPELYENVRQQIASYESKGYAHRASAEELAKFDPRRTWYLPLGVVINPNKPGKIRVVWDAAAKVDGVSYNSMLLKGPDLLASLPAVLQRFRQRQIAVTGDIREMFHQLLIRSEDRQSQLFLWYDSPSGEIHVYVMDVATFGSTCSPCSSQYVKNLNAEEWRCEFPEAVDAIVHNHYVDDYLDSRDSVEEATSIATAVKEVHAKDGFEIRNWLSNSDEVVRRVGHDSVADLAKSFAVDKNNGTERVLGMLWQPSSDVFTFSIRFRDGISQILNDRVVPTKREVLRLVMSLFDPLGLVAAFVVHGKCIIQDIWRSNVSWDEQIPEEIFNRWRRWVEVLKELDQVTIPRCYFPNYSPNSLDTLELHVFVDASEEAYACVAYFRIIDRGQVRCALVSAKSKVAPLKPLSIPRLELQAAVIGSRLVKSIEENHTLPIRRRVIWSDSSTVLSWIQSDQRKYRQFVAVRISEILDVTNIEEWRWVPTRLNVADEATKWVKEPSFHADCRWFVGPEFLYQEESAWPKRILPTKDTAEEMRPIHAHHRKIPEPLINYSRYSKWERLLRATAFLLRCVNNCRSKINGDPVELNPILSQRELKNAEEFLWRAVQMEAYPDEIIVLGRQQQQSSAARLEKTSPLHKLSPFVDETGVIKQEGRIGAANYASYDARFPIVLPRNHYVTGLVLDWYHRKYAHCNVETIVNEVRQKFHISNLRTAVRKQIRKCNWCIVYKATPRAPRMAPLPEARMSSYVRPFSFTGVDYCGPFYIRIGRSSVKRWVALFVCQTVRAIHLEVASSLSSESCKMAVRRFIARRGAPQQIFSDQGTNFHGARKELKQEIAGINQKLADTFTNCNTQWILNPPAAPHMGGSWERLVRSVKIGLNTLSTSRNPDEETFGTVLVEVEAIVNSRPLTHVPLDLEDDEALTPNHFLMLSSSGVVQPTKSPVDTGAVLKTNWGHAQSLLDLCWARWDGLTIVIQQLLRCHLSIEHAVYDRDHFPATRLGFPMLESGDASPNTTKKGQRTV
ncbi:uncharacterized protein LOC135710680 [Ochlerotatus camptorhynchus]|uniref:uncharacterized protein LOC135710680 n=1 Tax=Ochlerotatus camptorhynchus TaxID=644619 RepID=UPI0031DD8313